jgi:FkbM family methyltransferase
LIVALFVERLKTIKGLHQTYRDCLSQSFDFPSIGGMPVDLVRWVSDSRNTDTPQLGEFLHKLPNVGLPAEHDLALRLMLFTIMQANLAVVANNRFIDYEIPDQLKSDLRRNLSKILGLHDSEAYVANGIRLLYRANLIEDVAAWFEAFPAVIANHRDLQAIAGFLHTVSGDYAAALEYLTPLVGDEKGRQLPLVAMSYMTCTYRMGAPAADWPVIFETLQSDECKVSDLIPILPALEVVAPLERGDGRSIVFVACNDFYFFQHALFLFYSLIEKGAQGLAIHCHLYSPNESVLREIDSLRSRFPEFPIGVSLERGLGEELNSPTYYASARFVRAYQILELYAADVCVLDADALFNRGWEEFREFAGSTTEVMLSCPVAAPFWERVAAGFSYYRATPKARFFLGKVAEFILKNFQRQRQPWYIDQIALSACQEKYAVAQLEFAAVDSAILMDINHSRDAFTWVVTVKKDGNRRYDEFRGRLAATFGQLPQMSPDFIFGHLSTLKKPIFFLQVGTMDGLSYDPIHAHVKAAGWHGILVEPLDDMLDKARKNYAGCAGLIFENVAITERKERRTLYRISPDRMAGAQLPHWVLGMSTFQAGKLDQYAAHVVEVVVRCLPLAALLEKYRPTALDVVQIDTEGHDLKVLMQLDFARYQPFVINFEAVNLNPQETAAAHELLFENGYVCYRNGMDTFAVRRDIAFS